MNSEDACEKLGIDHELIPHGILGKLAEEGHNLKYTALNDGVTITMTEASEGKWTVTVTGAGTGEHIGDINTSRTFPTRLLALINFGYVVIYLSTTLKEALTAKAVAGKVKEVIGGLMDIPEADIMRFFMGAR